MFTLILLFLTKAVGLLLQFSARLLHRAVAPTVDAQTAIFKVNRLLRAGIQKIPVVRDHKAQSLVTLEPALKPQHGVEVQVVAWLVEQQQVRGYEQGACKIQSHSPAPRELLDSACALRCRKTETVKKTHHAWLGVGSAGFNPGVMGLCDRLRIVRRDCKGLALNRCTQREILIQ